MQERQGRSWRVPVLLAARVGVLVALALLAATLARGWPGLGLVERAVLLALVGVLVWALRALQR